MQRLAGQIRHYAWGSTDAIPALLGVPADGSPFAEYWLGAHPSAPSQLLSDTPAEVGRPNQASNQPLDAHLRAHPGELGASASQAFGSRLPFLLKVLSAAHSLSIQAHPSRQQAQAGFAAQNAAGVSLDAPTRVFRDDWPKPEMVVALSDFDALCGFRAPQRSAELLAGLAGGTNVTNDANLANLASLAELLRPLREMPDSQGLTRVVAKCLGGGEQVRATLSQLMSRATEHAGQGGAVGELARTAIELNADHPGDPSILVALLMNRIRLAPGQSMCLPAGLMHAYLRGTGIEIMANSDNVLRGGLTPKHIDVPTLMQLATFEPTQPQPEVAHPIGPGLGLYRTVFPEFRLWRLEPAGRPLALPATGLGRILLVVHGDMECSAQCGPTSEGPDFEGPDKGPRIENTAAGEKSRNQPVSPADPPRLTCHSGQAIWIPAGELAQASGAGLAFLAAAGTD